MVVGPYGIIKISRHGVIPGSGKEFSSAEVLCVPMGFFNSKKCQIEVWVNSEREERPPVRSKKLPGDKQKHKSHPIV